jgi:hypothetical protein
MLIDAGFDLYHKMNLDDPNDGLGAWVTKHAPLLDELKKSNAFEHGTGLGQFGGINAPYLSSFMNIFSPQQITPSNAQAAYKSWFNAIPALRGASNSSACLVQIIGWCKFSEGEQTGITIGFILLGVFFCCCYCACVRESRLNIYR